MHDYTQIAIGIISLVAFVMAGDPHIEKFETGELAPKMDKKVKGSTTSDIPERAVCKDTGIFESGTDMKKNESGVLKRIPVQKEIVRCFWTEKIKKSKLVVYGLTW